MLFSCKYCNTVIYKRYHFHGYCITCYYNFCINFRAISQTLCLLILTFLSFDDGAWSLPYPANLSNDTSSSSSNDGSSQQLQFLNERHYRVCDDGYGIYGVISVQHNHSEGGRLWYWQCRKLVQENSSHSCYWSKDVNYYNKHMSFTCCKNEYMRGVDSYHDNRHNDRTWSFYCCGSSGITTHSCYTTGYQNSLRPDGDVDFQASFGGVITGAFSQYDYYSE